MPTEKIINFIDEEIKRQEQDSHWKKQNGVNVSCDVCAINEWWEHIFKKELKNYLEKEFKNGTK